LRISIGSNEQFLSVSFFISGKSLADEKRHPTLLYFHAEEK
jgi:hypothetical protein